MHLYAVPFYDTEFSFSCTRMADCLKEHCSLAISSPNQRLLLLPGGKLKWNCPAYSNIITKSAGNLLEGSVSVGAEIIVDDHSYWNILLTSSRKL